MATVYRAAMAVSPTVDALEAELAAAAQVLEPQIAGFRDILLLPHGGDTQAILTEILRTAERRLDIIQRTRRDLEQLSADGYPQVEAIALDDSIYNDIFTDLAVMQAAAGRLRRQAPATSLDPTVTIVPKEVP